MSNDSNTVVRLNKHHIKPASEVLARAFDDYPIAEFAFPDVEERETRGPCMYEFTLNYGIHYGEVHATSERLEGVAIWLPPDMVSTTLWRLLRSGALPIMLRFGRGAGTRMAQFGRNIESIHKRNAPFRHWYLWTIGVDPQHQGKGHASTLLRAMFTSIDEEGLPCYLETQKEKNIPMYEHFGFKVVEQFVIPGTNFTNWAMLRHKAT